MFWLFVYGLKYNFPLTAIVKDRSNSELTDLFKKFGIYWTSFIVCSRLKLIYLLGLRNSELSRICLYRGLNFVKMFTNLLSKRIWHGFILFINVELLAEDAECFPSKSERTKYPLCVQRMKVRLSFCGHGQRFL